MSAESVDIHSVFFWMASALFMSKFTLAIFDF